MYVLVPPYIRRPIIRLAYCTGTRRCDCSTNTTMRDHQEPDEKTRMKVSHRPLWVWIAIRESGKRAAIEVKISSDMPVADSRGR
jgi:hypothetical protein